MVNDICHSRPMEDATQTPPASLHHTGDEPHLLREIVRTYQVLMSGFPQVVGISASRFSLLHQIATSANGCGTMDLARRLGVNAAAITRQIREMEAEGIVQRRDDPRDGRRSYVSLTSKGLALFEDVHTRGHGLERSFLSAASPEEIEVTARTLSKLRAFAETALQGERL